MKKKIACPECERGWCLACNNTGVVNGDPGMRKVVNLATNYMSALCETGAGPGRFDRFPAAEAEEKEAVKYLRARNYTHFKLSKRCALKR